MKTTNGFSEVLAVDSSGASMGPLEAPPLNQLRQKALVDDDDDVGKILPDIVYTSTSANIYIYTHTYIALHCITLHYVTLRYVTLRYIHIHTHTYT